jgi:hypothetical protein
MIRSPHHGSGFDPVRNVDVVILTNSSVSFDDLGFSLIVPGS